MTGNIYFHFALPFPNSDLCLCESTEGWVSTRLQHFFRLLLLPNQVGRDVKKKKNEAAQSQFFEISDLFMEYFIGNASFHVTATEALHPPHTALTATIWSP